jgi:uncharacterized membrane protein YjgN (DUF898 family)
MATAEAFSSPVPSDGAVRFLGHEAPYWRLRIKGAVYVLLTLGIYRFWLATDVRRYLWSNTEIAGETLEYNGLATELLVGFLLALAILVPLYMVVAIGALELGVVAVTAILMVLPLVALLAEFALYRARRYRLTRTVFRGVRFNQRGSAWHYALIGFAWWIVVLLTAGLAYPWAKASLQRFKLRNTSYGDLPGRFEATGSALFLRGVALWGLVFAPLVIGIVAFGAMTDWIAVNDILAKGDDNAFTQVAQNSGFRHASWVGLAGIGVSVLAAVLLYPVFQAIKLRWWMSGLRFGEVVVTSQLRASQVYRVYLRFILHVLLFTLAASVVGVVGLAAVGMLLGAAHDSNPAELMATVILVVLYVVSVLGVSTIYQVTVTAAMWRLSAQSADLSGAQALDTVRAAGAPISALGEGLADALRVGGI